MNTTIKPKIKNYLKRFIDQKPHILFFDDSIENFKRNDKINKNFIFLLSRINDVRFINKFFEKVNSKLQKGDFFVCNIETFAARRKRKKISRIPIISHLYFFVEFIFMRVFPKVYPFKIIYFQITKGKNRILSKAEALGRLISCGFEIIDFKSIDGKLHIISKKIGKPYFDDAPSYGPVYKMPRLGKNNKIIKVYKFRTMYPYSEYLQDYIYKKHGTETGDKANNDFRISLLGGFFRKFWIDELPMIINLLKGDIKLVGVRPLSKNKFKMYPLNVQKKRSKFKPGLIPPFYFDLPNNFKELIDSELKYLMRYKKNPFLTDLRYFFIIFYNIIIKGARSR